MHVLHPPPRWFLVAATAALALMLALIAAVLPGALEDASLSFGGGSADGTPVVITAPAPPATPTWIADPLASPVEDLRTLR